MNRDAGHEQRRRVNVPQVVQSSVGEWCAASLILAPFTLRTARPNDWETVSGWRGRPKSVVKTRPAPTHSCPTTLRVTSWRSRALEFDDMGAMWVPVREAVASGTLRATDKFAPDVAGRFDALLRFTSLQLGRQLGEEVTPALTRKEMADPASRARALVSSLCTSGTMQGGIRIPNAVGPLMVTADLRASRIICHIDIDIDIDIDAQREGRPTTRANWLLRQLKQAPDNLRIEAFAMHARGAGAAELLRDVRENPALLVQDPSKELQSFRIALTTGMGSKRGRGRGSFIDSVTDTVNALYSEVVQNLKTWTAAPPKMR